MRREASAIADSLPARVAFEAGVFRRERLRLFCRTGHSRAVRRMLDDSGASLVHAHFVSDASYIAATARRVGLPLVVTAHGYDVTAMGRLDSQTIRRYRSVFESASSLVAVSRFVADRLMALGAPGSKIEVLPIGVPVSAAVASVEPEARDIDAIFVGRLVAKKGADHAIRAMGEAQRSLRRTLRLTVVGDGPERSALERLARDSGLHASFLGVQPPSVVAAEMRRARCFIGPSQTGPDGDSEGFGMVFLEAGLAHLPVLAYHHGGVPEAVVHGSTGLLAAEGSLDELTRNLVRLLGNPSLLGELGAAGYERVVRDFDVRARTLILEQLYDRVVAR